MSVLNFPTPDAQLVKATLAMAETEQLRAQLEHVRAERDSLAEKLDGLVDAALETKRLSKAAVTDLARLLLASRFVELVLKANEEPSVCPTCEQVVCVRDCPESGQ